MSSSPVSVMGAIRSSMPWLSRSICQGTRFAWCSMALMITAWPGCMRARP